MTDIDFTQIRDKFVSMDAWGLHTIINLHGCNPETIRSPEKVKEYVDKLCDLIEMKKFGDCTVVNFGEDERVAGLSMTQLIETSLISGHFANLTGTSYIDIFSCKLYDPQKALEFTRDFFEGKEYTMEVVFRK